MASLLARGVLLTMMLILPRTMHALVSPAVRLPSKVFLRSSRFFSSTDSVMVKPKVLVPIADGTEEMEAVTVIDVLVRAGAAVTVASVSQNLNVACSRGVHLRADTSVDTCSDTHWDLIVCPGGMPGAEHLSSCSSLIHLLQEHNRKGGLIGAICASPAVILAKHHLLEGKRATCYPHATFTSKLSHYVSDQSVVVDGNVITSQGPGTAMDFSLALASALFGEEKVTALKHELVLH